VYQRGVIRYDDEFRASQVRMELRNREDKG
jgi:hypothetical protein